MDRSQLRSRARIVLLAGAMLLVPIATSLAEPPAAIAPQGREDVRIAFDRFATDWMAKVQRLEEQQRANPTVRPGSGKPLVTYRGYGSDWKTELRATGHPSAPYVGILRYREHLYSCDTVAAENCTVASTVPVTEIFRFEDGRWVY